MRRTRGERIGLAMKLIAALIGVVTVALWIAGIWVAGDIGARLGFTGIVTLLVAIVCAVVGFEFDD